MKKTKKIGSNILIIVLIFLAIASVCAGLFAWAKYQTTINGTATGETAKWSFKVTDGNTQTADIDFPMSRTDNNTSVVEGKIAPGTYGELKIEIDASGTETALIYRIEAQMENAPRNLKFYSDSSRTVQLNVIDNKFTKNGYMMLDEIGKREEKIYWEWPYETGTTATWINKNDEIDTEDSDKQMSMELIITGEQINSNPRLADLVQVGDYVDYNASSNGTKTFTSDDCAKILEGNEGKSGHIAISDTINTDEDFNSDAKSQWRVLSVDRKAGIVELIAVDPTTQTVTLAGEKGFGYAETVLKNIGEIYGQGKGASAGRSIKIEDIEQYSSYDKRSFTKYGQTKNYTSGKFHKEIKDENGNIEYESIRTLATTTSPITMTYTYYIYHSVNNYFANITAHNMIFKNATNTSSYKSKFWLSSRCVILNDESCNFHVGYIGDNSVLAGRIGNSAWEDYFIEAKYGFVPVVSLETNIQTIGQDENGVWQLSI